MRARAPSGCPDQWRHLQLLRILQMTLHPITSMVFALSMAGLLSRYDMSM